MTNQIHYEWKRLWCRRGTTINFSDSLDFPNRFSLFEERRTQAVSFDSLMSIPCLILLGEPGIGKSTELDSQFDRIKNQVHESNDEYLKFDLRDYQTDQSLFEDVFEDPYFQQWFVGSNKLYLFFDSLDEALLSIETIATALVRKLRNKPVNRLFLRIACRTADWPSILEDGLKGIWGADKVEAIELIPLQREDIITACIANGIDANLFLEEISRHEAESLAIKPVTLDFLLNTYKKNQLVPSRKVELYQEGVRQLCGEINRSRLASGRSGLLSSEQRVILAARIAAVTIFSNRSAIWIGANPNDMPEMDVSIEYLSGRMECVNGTEFSVGIREIKEVLDTGLFSSRDVDRLGWAHRTYEEYLAAWYLNQHKVPEAQIRNLIVHSGALGGQLVPQLHETCAWIASLSSEMFKIIQSIEPKVLLYSDVASFDNRDREFLVDAILNLYDEGRVI